MLLLLCYYLVNGTFLSCSTSECQVSFSSWSQQFHTITSITSADLIILFAKNVFLWINVQNLAVNWDTFNIILLYYSQQEFSLFGHRLTDGGIRGLSGWEPEPSDFPRGPWDRSEHQTYHQRIYLQTVKEILF